MTVLPAMQDETDGDTLHEECAVFGIFGHADAGRLTVLGPARAPAPRPGSVGHRHLRQRPVHGRAPCRPRRRYLRRQARRPRRESQRRVRHRPQPLFDRGGSRAANIQPMFADLAGGGIAIAHNGNLTNARILREEPGARRRDLPIDLGHRGDHPPGRAQQVRPRRQPRDRCAEAGDRRLFAGRADVQEADRRARSVGRASAGARRTRRRADPGVGDLCARHHPATFVRDVEPGEMVVCTQDGIESFRPFNKQPHRFCVFEYIYFARPDSMVEGRNVYEMRKRAGVELGRARPRPMPTSSSLCRIRASQRRSALPSPQGSRSSSASSATTMSGAPSLSRRTASATSACAASTIRTAPRSRASASC